MKIVIAQHKGGIGKTSLATHIAGALSEYDLEETLLMDCDTQGDAFKFFTGEFPNYELKVRESLDCFKNIEVMWNPNRKKLYSKGIYSEYDNVVVDINTRLPDALQIIIELNPDLVLVPIDRQRLSTTHLAEVIDSLNSIQGVVSYPFETRIVQMGCEYSLETILNGIPNVPSSCYIEYHIPNLYEEFDNALSNSKYVWQIILNEELKSKFQEVIS